MKRAIRKRSYLLLEIFLSLTLIVLCFFPLIKPHTAIKKADLALITKLKSHRQFNNAYVQLLEKLYNHKYSWKQLREGFSDKLEIGSFTITPLHETTKTSSQRRGLLLSIELFLEGSSRHHTLFIEELS